MDRATALQASKWLTAIEGHEDFISAVDRLFDEYNDGIDMTGYVNSLYAVLNKELAARKKALEDL